MKSLLARKYVILFAGVIIVVSTIVVGLKWWNSREFFNISSTESFSTSIVTMGNVFKVIEAHGETAAENEVLILCPAGGIVENVLRLPGNKVSTGEVILTLETSELQQKLSDAQDQLELLNNNLYKLDLSSRTTRIDLEHDIEVRKLRIASLKAELSDQEELLDVGGISQAKIDKTKQEIVLAEKEFDRSTQKHKLKLQQLKAEREGLLLEIAMKEKEGEQSAELINKMIIKSPGTGIILEVKARKGENKQKNELLVRISEETRVKIKGEIDGKFSSNIRNGGKVFVDLDTNRLHGVIGNIQPELTNDNIQFDVFLENPNNDDLKVNQKVTLFIVNEERENVLRVKKGNYFQTNRSICYVIEEDVVVKRTIKSGLKGLDYIEINSGLEIGEEVINSTINKTRNTGRNDNEEEKILF